MKRTVFTPAGCARTSMSAHVTSCAAEAVLYLAPGLLVLFLAFSVAASLSAEQWQSSFGAAVFRARQEKKPILLEFHAVWCGYCARMKREIFQQSIFSRKASGFVLLSIDGEREEGLADRFRLRGFPTILFLDSNGVEISRLQGYADPDRFYRAMEAAYEDRDIEDVRLKAVKDSPDGFRSNYEAGVYYANALEYARARDYYWRAYRSGASDQDQTGQMRRKALYNIAVLSMRLKDYPLSASLWDAYVRTQSLQNSEMSYARYWRGVSRLRAGTRNADAAIREDLEYAERHLPLDREREDAAELLKSLKK